MTIKLYELAGAEDGRRFSPYCWRIRFALEHKDLPYEGIPCRFTEKDLIAFSGQEKVPVLVDGDTVLFDSWTIACHLEQAYPDRPSLFGGDRARDLSRFYIDWADMVLMGALIRLLATDIHDHLHDKDKTYFRQSREKRFGMSLEEFCADRDQSRSNLHRALAPLRATLQRQPYLGGDSPLYADYAVMGGFMWARSISPLKLMEDDDPVTQWRERLLERVGESSRQLLAYA